MKKLLLIIFTLFILFIPLNTKTNSDLISNTNKYIFVKETNYVVANMKILGTDFNSAVVQAGNNNFFLNHDIYGNTSNLGSVFLDYRNNLTDKKLLIYGHNSKQLENAPFHYLENFLDKEFVNKHQYLLLSTFNESVFYQLFTVMIAIDDFQHVNLNFTKVNYYNHIKWLQDNSIYSLPISLTANDSILILQTCYYKPEHSYLLIGYKKIVEEFY